MAEEQKREFTGIWIPRAVVEDDRLNWSDRAVFGEIACFEQCYMTNETLANVMGISPSQVRAIISKLKDYGYIRQVAFDGRRRFLQTYTNADVDNSQSVEAKTPEENPEHAGKPAPRALKNQQAESWKTSTIDNNRENSLENNEVINRKRFAVDNQNVDNVGIVVNQSFQAKALYITERLGSKQSQMTSVLKICREHSEYEVEEALSTALESSARDKTLVFFKAIHTAKIGKPV